MPGGEALLGQYARAGAVALCADRVALGRCPGRCRPAPHRKPQDPTLGRGSGQVVQQEDAVDRVKCLRLITDPLDEKLGNQVEQPVGFLGIGFDPR